jgi:membrane protease YdiL (CAAX protease family)
MKGLPPRQVHPALQILMLVGLAVVGLSLASFVALAIAQIGYGISAFQFADLTANPSRYPHAWDLLMIYEGLSLAGLGAGALVVPLVLRQGVGSYFTPHRLGAAWWLGGAALLIICLIPFLSTIVAWNANVHFPAGLHDFELWARDKETQAGDLTKFLTDFNTPSRLLVGLLVIALVPGIAEELVFRGVIQRNLVRLFGSRHVGVWLAAAVFSAVHVQFFGFVPRFLLGLVLGYLYEWSGNILVSMVAHFTQNAFQLVLLYLAQSRHLPSSLDPDSNQALPWPSVLLSAVLSAALLYFLYQRFTQASARPLDAEVAVPPSF